MPSLAIHRLVPALALCSLIACGKGDAGSDSAGAPAAAATSSAASDGSGDLADVTNYRLTMDKVDRYLDVQRNVGKRFAAMSPAERQAAKDVATGAANGGDSLDEMADRIGKHPVMAAAVRDAGLTPREFSLITISLMQSSMAAAVLKMRPNDNQDSLAREMKANPANIAFVQQHQDEIKRKSDAISAEMKRLGVDE